MTIPACLALFSGSTWIVISVSSTSSRSARSIRSQMSWAADTAMSPGTTKWKSTNVTFPAWRVRRSCASSAPSAWDEITSRMWLKVFSGTASSIRPPTDSRDSFLIPLEVTEILVPSRTNDTVLLRAHLAVAALFLPAGIGKLSNLAGFTAMLTSKDVLFPDLLAVLGVAAEILGPVELILGVSPRLTALLLIGFTLVASLISHSFWTFADAAQVARQQTQFLKNLAIIGGLLFYFVSGAFSLPASGPARLATCRPADPREPDRRRPRLPQASGALPPEIRRIAGHHVRAKRHRSCNFGNSPVVRPKPSGLEAKGAPRPSRSNLLWRKSLTGTDQFREPVLGRRQGADPLVAI
jgi:putative oxidoreductase